MVIVRVQVTDTRGDWLQRERHKLNSKLAAFGLSTTEENPRLIATDEYGAYLDWPVENQ